MNKAEEARSDSVLRDKINSMITNQDVRQKVVSKLESQNITLPSLKLEVLESNTDVFTIEEADVLKVFNCFGEVVSLKVIGKNAFIKFTDIVSAYFALTILNGKQLPELNVALQVSWHQEPVDRAPLVEWRIKEPPKEDVKKNIQENEKEDDKEEEKLKFTCRYEVQIINDFEFKVARKIIGLKGNNMKKIIEKCSKGINSKSHNVVKLRLRGQGSGYKEGPNSAESQDSLNLCISSKFRKRYMMAMAEIEKLLMKVYKDYDQYCLSIGIPEPRLGIIKNEKVTGMNMLMAPARIKELEDCIQLNEDEIEDLIDIRNDARKQCNYAQADRIRELLRVKGVMLMDEKGGRGKGTDVTNWKYIKPL